MTEVSERNDKGQFVKGQSGNPEGRPKGKKNQLTILKQDLEIAIRENVKVQDVQDVVNKMLDLAKAGNVGAAKLVLDKVITNARDSEDVQDGNTGFTFIVKNVTVQQETQKTDDNIIDVTPEED